MIKVNVVVNFPKWKKKIKDPKKYLQKKINKLKKILPFKKKNQEFSILLTNNNMMKKLNRKFRKKNKKTDVLSFPLKTNSYIGDIAISFEMINKKSSLSNFSYEFDKTWIHGYLHLLGHDHKKIKDYKKMQNKEKIILQSLNK